MPTIKDERFTNLRGIATIPQTKPGSTVQPLDTDRFVLQLVDGALVVDVFLTIDGILQQVRLNAADILTDTEANIMLMARTRLHVAAIRAKGFALPTP